MIYSNACEYGIRAMVHLVGAGDKRMLAREISEREGIPGPFLGKVFQTLVKAGLLNSSKGPGGGFTLARDPAKITIYDIRQAVDGIDDLEGCAVGLAQCSDDTPCPLHDSWKPVRAQIKAYLTKTTLTDMAAAMERKRAAAKRRRAR